MRARPHKLLMGFYFYPRGGSAHACEAISAELEGDGFDVTLLAGSRSDNAGLGSAVEFFSARDLRAVDFTDAIACDDRLGFQGGPGSAPMHASYEDRRDAEDPVFASLDDDAFECQVDAWSRELAAAGAADADVLYLHHLTPLNEAARRVAPEVPVLGHIHGSELLMLERIAAGAPPSWEHADRWAARICDWAAGCAQIIVNSPKGLKRASSLLDLHPARFTMIPNGFGRDFAPRPIDRPAHWRRHLVDQPRGWAPGEAPGSVGYEASQLQALEGTTLLAVGRFTAVKRLPLLVEAFAAARARLSEPAALVLLGGYPGEWEGEHPLEAIERLGTSDVFLAGWHPHHELPDFLNASDLLVHPSVLEQFGQVLVEAMACGVPAIAVERGGPATIVDHAETGWLIP
ncbi:MAG: glycosyltransferase family 4 protein, partial [Actinomycetota bacterium]|nr:glycosyltransferase family 4 protein [Actinomycetota bacterium]